MKKRIKQIITFQCLLFCFSSLQAEKGILLNTKIISSIPFQNDENIEIFSKLKPSLGASLGMEIRPFYLIGFTLDGNYSFFSQESKNNSLLGINLFDGNLGFKINYPVLDFLTLTASSSGEVVKNIQGRKDLYLLLVFPKTSSSTKLAYSLIDKMYERGESLNAPSFDSYESIYNQNPENWTFVNTFTPVISSEYEEIEQALISVRKTGALYSEVSGSGSTVYGIFISEQQAETAKSLLADKWSCKVCRTL